MFTSETYANFAVIKGYPSRVENIAARLREAARSQGKARRLRVRQIEMYLRWKHNLNRPLSLITRLTEEIAQAEDLARSRAIAAAGRLVGKDDCWSNGGNHPALKSKS